MGIPERSLLDMFEEQRAKAKLTFQSDMDANGQDRWTNEMVQKLGAAVHLIPMSSRRGPQGAEETNGVDKLYGDIKNPSFLAEQERINFRAIVEHNPSKQKLKKFGIEEEREVIFWFPAAALKQAGLVTERRFRGVDIGDFVIWDGTWYVVESVHRQHYFGQSDRYFFTGAFANRYHHNVVSEQCPPSDFQR